MARFALLLLSACFFGSCAAGPVQGNLVATYGDASQLIMARSGTRIALSLPSNPSTGFQWQHTVVDGLEAVVIDSTRSKSGASGLLGSSGTEEVVLAARKPGSARIRSTYSRPWEKGVAPARSITWTLMVQP